MLKNIRFKLDQLGPTNIPIILLVILGLSILVTNDIQPTKLTEQQALSINKMLVESLTIDVSCYDSKLNKFFVYSNNANMTECDSECDSGWDVGWYTTDANDIQYIISKSDQYLLLESSNIFNAHIANEELDKTGLICTSATK